MYMSIYTLCNIPEILDMGGVLPPISKISVFSPSPLGDGRGVVIYSRYKISVHLRFTSCP